MEASSLDNSSILSLRLHRLYIIGNGFDFHYGIKNRYSFLCFVEHKNEELYDLLFQLFPPELCSKFEYDLGMLRPKNLSEDIFGCFLTIGGLFDE